MLGGGGIHIWRRCGCLSKKLELNQLEDDQSGCSSGFTWPVKEAYPDRIADIWWTCCHSLVSPQNDLLLPRYGRASDWLKICFIQSEADLSGNTSSVWNSLCCFLSYHFAVKPVAGKNSRFSSLFAAGDVLRWGTSASQQQKFCTDDVKSVQNQVRSADRTTQ